MHGSFPPQTLCWICFLPPLDRNCDANAPCRRIILEMSSLRLHIKRGSSPPSCKTYASKARISLFPARNCRSAARTR
jgi:hypothetical protein